jgi:hypothetical protein
MQKVPELVFLCVGQSWVKDWEDRKSLQAFTAYEQAYSTITGRTFQYHQALQVLSAETGDREHNVSPLRWGKWGETLKEIRLDTWTRHSLSVISWLSLRRALTSNYRTNR